MSISTMHSRTRIAVCLGLMMAIGSGVKELRAQTAPEDSAPSPTVQHYFSVSPVPFEQSAQNTEVVSRQAGVHPMNVPSGGGSAAQEIVALANALKNAMRTAAAPSLQHGLKAFTVFPEIVQHTAAEGEIAECQSRSRGAFGQRASDFRYSLQMFGERLPAVARFVRRPFPIRVRPIHRLLIFQIERTDLP